MIARFLPLILVPVLLSACGDSSDNKGGGVSGPVAVPLYPDERPAGEAPKGMVWIPGGEFAMGSDDTLAWPEEKPAHRVRVHGYWMDSTEVTNAQFTAFVDATGYITDAEKAPLLEDIMAQVPPGTPEPQPEDLVPGALVFNPVGKELHDCRYLEWWSWTHGADWKHPEGPESNISDRMDHPVVQVSWNDAVAYCTWAGKRLPTEAEWERAARGGVESMPYIWGEEHPTDTLIKCNSWQGTFPQVNSAADGYIRTAPVGRFAPNGFGLYDMAGNVWEWCSDWLDMTLYPRRVGTLTTDPHGPEKSFDPERRYEPLRAQRGGSFLCHDTYCWRYRPSARQGSTPDSGMSHVGFRCVQDAETGAK